MNHHLLEETFADALFLYGHMNMIILYTLIGITIEMMCLTQSQ